MTSPLRPRLVTPPGSIRSGLVKSASTFTAYRPVRRDPDGTFLDCGANEAAEGVATGTAQPGEVCEFQNAGIAIVTVGTGGATPGSLAVVVADGVTDAPALGGGTILVNVVGRFEEPGVIGDQIGMTPFATTVPAVT